MVHRRNDCTANTRTRASGAVSSVSAGAVAAQYGLAAAPITAATASSGAGARRVVSSSRARACSAPATSRTGCRPARTSRRPTGRLETRDDRAATVLNRPM
jgi:hypothetical protein